jgi:hypothetical protein
MSPIRPFALRISSLVLASASLASVAACNSADPLPIYFDLNYQVGCVLPECTAISDGPARTVMAVDGENGFQNSCAASTVNGGKLVNLSTSNSGLDIRFEITSAVYDSADGNVGSACRVKIVEGSNSYEGRCSAAAPTPAIPCQLTEFRATDSGALEGKLYCNDLPVGASPTTTRDIARAGAFDRCTNSSGAEVDPSQCPATFLIDPCDGL